MHQSKNAGYIFSHQINLIKFIDLKNEQLDNRQYYMKRPVFYSKPSRNAQCGSNIIIIKLHRPEYV